MNAFAATTCFKQWGKVKMSSKSQCRFQLPASAEPSSVVIRDFKWELHKNNIVFKIALKEAQNLKGMKFTFYHRGTPQAEYTLPLYSDINYNLLQNGPASSLSIAASELVWKVDKKSRSKSFDSVSMFLLTHEERDKNLRVSIVDHYEVLKAKKGAISITFDDGYRSNFHAAAMMAALELRGTAYIIPRAIDTPGYLNSQEVATMKKWGWGISSHLKTPVTEIKKLDESLTAAKLMTKKLSSHTSAEHFALPLGKYDHKSLKVLKKNFKSVRLAGGGIETLPVGDRFRLKAINVTSDMSVSDIIKLCEAAIANKDWVILMFHYLDRPEFNDLSYSAKKFESLIKALAPMRDHVKTIDEVL
jgi:hypothetical protein